MRLSLEVLKDIPGHEDRLKVYEEISLSLQEVLLPMVKGEISGHDIGSLQEYLFIFKKLDRLILIFYCFAVQYVLFSCW